MAADMHELGALVRQFRMQTQATTIRSFHGTLRSTTSPLSQNELARRSAVDVAYVHRIERGTGAQPTRRVVEGLAKGLELDTDDRARLLAAAGYWPWPDVDGETAELILAAGLAIVAGDWRRVPLPEAHQNGSRSHAHRPLERP
jgi:transcriptional regulator with XRE-family HTH domain